MSHRYLPPVRWGDMDAQGHVNNAAIVDYLQEARVHFLLSGPPVMADLLAEGVLVVQHQIEYAHPVTFGDPVEIELWVDAVGASRFVIGYELRVGERRVGRARTVATPYELAAGRLRRLSEPERTVLRASLAPAEPLPPLPRIRWSTGGEDFSLAVRWADLDSYGHVNNVKFYDYIQEARVALIRDHLGWDAGAGVDADEPWVIVRQDLDYLRPMDFRIAPYQVATVVSAIGTRSVTLAAEIRDSAEGTVFAAARTVLVGPRPLTDSQRTALDQLRRSESPGTPPSSSKVLTIE